MRNFSISLTQLKGYIVLAIHIQVSSYIALGVL